MITGEKAIVINVGIFTKNIKQLEETYATLRQDCIRAILDRQERIQKTGDKDIQIHLRQDSKCAYCGQPAPKCQCGRPTPRPLVQ
jgi:hypothetical protein